MSVRTSSCDCARCPLGRAVHPTRCALRPVARPAGALLVRQGEAPDGAWFVRAGRLLLTSTSPGGNELHCVIRARGSMVGLEALRGAPADYEAWTLEPAQLCRLTEPDARRWLAENAPPARALLDLALDEVLRARDERLALAGGSLERVGRFLLSHLRTSSTRLTMQQQLLARLLRMRPETLSRVLARLRAAGAIAEGRSVRVLDAQRLAEMVGEAAATAGPRSTPATRPCR